MRYVAAYLLAVLGGNKNPSKDDLEKILGAVGLEVDEERVEKVVSELNGKDINEVMKEGMGKLACIPSGGVAVASAGGGGGGGGGGGSGEGDGAGGETKEEKKEESEEESDDDMGFGLFD